MEDLHKLGAANVADIVKETNGVLLADGNKVGLATSLAGNNGLSGVSILLGALVNSVAKSAGARLTISTILAATFERGGDYNCLP